jgi:hypothetical protein
MCNRGDLLTGCRLSYIRKCLGYSDNTKCSKASAPNKQSQEQAVKRKNVVIDDSASARHARIPTQAQVSASERELDRSIPSERLWSQCVPTASSNTELNIPARPGNCEVSTRAPLPEALNMDVEAVMLSQQDALLGQAPSLPHYRDEDTGTWTLTLPELGNNDAWAGNPQRVTGSGNVNVWGLTGAPNMAAMTGSSLGVIPAGYAGVHAAAPTPTSMCEDFLSVAESRNLNAWSGPVHGDPNAWTTSMYESLLVPEAANANAWSEPLQGTLQASTPPSGSMYNDFLLLPPTNHPNSYSAPIQTPTSTPIWNEEFPLQEASNTNGWTIPETSGAWRPPEASTTGAH